MVKKKIFRKMRKFFILPLFILCLFSCILCVNADSLIYQSNPFIIQGTATDNGESIADVSPVAFLFEKRGHSEVVNNEIVNADGQYLVNIGRNQWDEEWELGTINVNTGENISYDGSIRSINYIRVIPNTLYYARLNRDGVIFYYDEDMNFISPYGLSNDVFTTPINCCFIRFKIDSATTYNNDITISLYYEDEEGYDEYYEYQEVSRVDTGSEVLRSAGSVYDFKTPDGTLTRSVGSYTFTGDETITATTSNRFYFKGLSSVIKHVVYTDVANLLAEGFTTVKQNAVETHNYQIAVEDSGWIYFYFESDTTLAQAKSYLSGKTINYELATPTTEQGTSYSQNYYVDDFGSQYWLDENMNYVEVGQAGLYGYNFDFVYSWYDNIVRMIVAPIKSLGGSIVNFVKTGFVQLFTTQEVVNDVVVYHASPIAWFTFALMGIALAMSLTYFLVNLLRRSK